MVHPPAHSTHVLAAMVGRRCHEDHPTPIGVNPQADSSQVEPGGCAGWAHAFFGTGCGNDLVPAHGAQGWDSMRHWMVLLDRYYGCLCVKGLALGSYIHIRHGRLNLTGQ